ncbi:hypothetical protein FGB62_74g117 [Gracilaria domingensis]|nr:hypothetical protein FGB62_74g117 [Gracilaria domingensis]
MRRGGGCVRMMRLGVTAGALRHGRHAELPALRGSAGALVFLVQAALWTKCSTVTMPPSPAFMPFRSLQSDKWTTRPNQKEIPLARCDTYGPCAMRGIHYPALRLLCTA